MVRWQYEGTFRDVGAVVRTTRFREIGRIIFAACIDLRFILTKTLLLIFNPEVQLRMILNFFLICVDDGVLDIQDLRERFAGKVGLLHNTYMSCKPLFYLILFFQEFSCPVLFITDNMIF